MFEGQPFAALFLQKLSVDTSWQDVQKSQNLTPQKLDSKIETITSKKIVSVKYISISILKKLKNLGSFSYFSLFKKGMSRSVIVATFLAILELIKIKKIKIK